MQQFRTSMHRLFMVSAIAGMMAGTSCTSSKLTLVHPAPATETAAAVPTPETDGVAAAQGAQTGAPADEVYASTVTNTAPAVSTIEKARQENQAASVKNNVPAKKLSLPARMALKAVAKKLEKAQAKQAVKEVKANKSGKAISDPTIRTGLIIALVGLVLVIIGALIPGLGFLYFLGGLGITVGLVVVLLAALDVI